MRSLLKFILVALFATPWAIAAPQLKHPPAENWTIFGEWIPDDGGQQHEYTESGTLVVGGVAGAKSRSYVVNTKTSPAEFELSIPGKNVKWLGICKVEGDTLTICLNLQSGDPRPTKFEKSSDPLVSLRTYKRKTPKN